MPADEAGVVRVTSRRALDRELRALLARSRLHDFTEELLDRPVRVTATHYRGGGRRVRFELASGTWLELRLYWPRSESLVELHDFRADPRIGWIALGTTETSAKVTYYAWLATLSDGSATVTG